MDTQTQIDRLIELAIVQRTDLKKLVSELPQLREHLSAEIERTFDEFEPQLRTELEEFCATRADDKHAKLSAELSAKIESFSRSLQDSAQAKFSALLREREENVRVAKEAEDKIAEHAASLPSAVKEIVEAELSRFPRAGEIDQLRKEFQEPRGLNPRGKWTADEVYNKLDLVAYNGDSFVSNTNGNRERPNRSSDAWTLNAARGNAGGGGGISSLTDILPIPSSGQILGSEGPNYTPKNLVAGANITITETPTQITITGDEGQIELQDGTAAAPSLFFVNDVDTGLFRPGTNLLGIAAGGQAAITIGATEMTLNVTDVKLGGDLSIDNDTLYIDKANSRVGIGTSTPNASLVVRSQGSTNTRSVLVEHVDNTTAFSQAKFIGARSRGSHGSPSAVLANDSLASFNGQGYKASAWSNTVGGFYVYAAENWTNAATGSFAAFRLAATGGTTVSEVARLTSTGNFLVGGTSDIPGGGGLKVFGTTASTSTTTGALQVAGGVGVSGSLYNGGAIVLPSSNSFVSATSGRAILAYTAAGGMTITGAGSVNDFTLYNKTGSVVLENATGTQNVKVVGTTASTSTTTGALQVAGGVGVAGALNVGGNTRIAETSASLGVTPRLRVDAPNTNTGPAIAAIADSSRRGIIVYEAGYINGTSGSVVSLSPTETGGSIFAGQAGATIGGSLLITAGNGVTTSANLTVNGGTVGTAASTNLTLAGGSSGASLVLGQGANGNVTANALGTGLFRFVNAANTQLHLGPGGGSPAIFIQPNLAGTAIYAALTGTAQRWAYADDAQLTNIVERMRLTSGGNLLLGTTTDSANGRLQLADHTTSAGGIGFGTDVTLYRSAANVLKTDDALIVASATASTSTTTGALQVAGGVGVAGTVFIGGIITSTSLGRSSLSGPLKVNNRNVAGDATSLGDLQIFSASTTEIDIGGLEWKADAGGSGYGFRTLPVFNGVSTYDLYTQARSNSATWTTRTVLTQGGNLLIGGTTNITGSGGLKVFGSTASTSTTTGALQVAGGAGIGGALFTGGAVTTSAPTGGAGAWELGVANTVTPTAPDRTITIEIGGTVYYLHAKTTND